MMQWKYEVKLIKWNLQEQLKAVPGQKMDWKEKSFVHTLNIQDIWISASDVVLRD